MLPVLGVAASWASVQRQRKFPNTFNTFKSSAHPGIQNLPFKSMSNPEPDHMDSVW